MSKPDRKTKPTAFIVHGHDSDAVDVLAQTLDDLGLAVIPFAQHADRLGPLPVISQVVRTGIASADVIIVLFTPDEHAALYDKRTGLFVVDDPAGARWQARPNVIFEAGWAYGLRPKRTVFASIGEETTLFSDIAGHHVIRLDATDGMQRLRARLEGILRRKLGAPPVSDAEFRKALARPRWRVHEELSTLRATMDNIELYLSAEDKRENGRSVRLLVAVEQVVQAHPDWSWSHRQPLHLVRDIVTRHNDFVADYAFWWLISIGFFQFGDVEYWGDHWTDSIKTSNFAERGRAFLQWCKRRPLAKPAPAKRR